MASPTPNKGYTYPAHGGAVNAWDTPLNANFDQIDLNVGGYYPITCGSSIVGATYNSSYATLSSSITNAVFPSSIAQNLYYSVSGTLSNNLTLTYPAGGGIYFIRNASSGAFSVSAVTAAGGSVPYVIPQGGGSLIVSDGVSPQQQSNKADNPVPYSQMQHESVNTILGNISSASAVPSEIILGAGITATSSTSTISVLAVPVPAAFKNLSIKVATNTTVTVAADFVTMTDGTNYRTVAVSGTCDLGSAGAVNKLDAGAIAAATWYSIWAIYNPTTGTAGTLASLSATAPTLPAGYTYQARIGWVRTAPAIAQLLGTWQLGRRARYVVGLAQTANLPALATGTQGNVSIPTWVAISVSGFVPSTASMIAILVRAIDASGTVMVAPNSSYGNNVSTTNPPFAISGWSGGADLESGFLDLMLESTNVYYAANGINEGIFCMGWEDNI